MIEKIKQNWKYITASAILLVLVITRITGIWGTFIVSGESMLPNYRNGDLLLGSNLSVKDGINRGDVVVLKAPNGSKVIKRVIGLPKEYIRIIDGAVYINDKKLDEPYLDNGHTTLKYDMSEFQIGENQVFVMGDNRDNSLDSRAYGTVSIDAIESQPFSQR